MFVLTITEPCLNPEFPLGELKNIHTPRIFVFLRGPMIWKVMPRKVWSDIVSWQTKRVGISGVLRASHLSVLGRASCAYRIDCTLRNSLAQGP